MTSDEYKEVLTKAIEAKLPEWRAFFPENAPHLTVSGMIMAINDSVNHTLKPFLSPGMTGGIYRSKLFSRMYSSRRRLSIRVKGLYEHKPVHLHFRCGFDRLIVIDVTNGQLETKE